MSGSTFSGSSIELHARDRERIALQELQHAEALDALADDVMRTVGRRDVAQHVGRWCRPSAGRRAPARRRRACSAAGCRAGAAGARPPAPRRRERSRPTVSGNTMPGKQHDVAHRHDDQRVVGQRARRALAPRRLPRPRERRPGCRRRRTTGCVLELVSSFMSRLARLAQPQYQAAVERARACRPPAAPPAAECVARSTRRESRAAAPRSANRQTAERRSARTTSAPDSVVTSTRSAGTPGSATTTTISRSSSNTSTGGSHTACVRSDAASRKNCRCMRSACVDQVAGLRPHPVGRIA